MKGTKVLMPTRIDFHAVAQEHYAIHERLQNWARWCYSNGGRTVAPMFRLYRSTDQWTQVHVSDTVDSLDAQAVQKGVSHLPERNRKALAWCYVLRNSPKRAARDLSVSMDGLMDLVTVGRTMLVNRRV
jgi:hypothetical protein